jgi:hypothetical protein
MKTLESLLQQSELTEATKARDFGMARLQHAARTEGKIVDTDAEVGILKELSQVRADPDSPQRIEAVYHLGRLAAGFSSFRLAGDVSKVGTNFMVVNVDECHLNDETLSGGLYSKPSHPYKMKIYFSEVKHLKKMPNLKNPTLELELGRD